MYRRRAPSRAWLRSPDKISGYFIFIQEWYSSYLGYTINYGILITINNTINNILLTRGLPRFGKKWPQIPTSQLQLP